MQMASSIPVGRAKRNMALQRACREGDVKGIAELLEDGAEMSHASGFVGPYKRGHARCTPLLQAVSAGKEEAALLLLERGASLGETREDRLHLFFRACEQGLASQGWSGS